jgi:hypothetical protein
LRGATEARIDFIMRAMRPSIDGALQREHRDRWNHMNEKRSVLSTHGSTTGAKNTALP